MLATIVGAVCLLVGFVVGAAAGLSMAVIWTCWSDESDAPHLMGVTR